MSQVLEIDAIRFEGDHLIVDAVVSDMVVVRPETRFDPPEWGPALCRGSMYFSGEELIPATDGELKKLLTETIEDWAPLDLSDWGD